MMADLFETANRPPPRPPAAPALQPTGRFVADPRGGAAHFTHHCAVCGVLDAPFGRDVHLRDAIAAGDARRAGVWLCFGCWTEAGKV